MKMIGSKSRDGGGIIYVLFLLVMLSTLGIAVLSSSVYGIKLERQAFEVETDFVHAEAAIHRYQFFLNLNEEYYESTYKMDNEVDQAIANGVIRRGEAYPISDDKNIFIKSITKNDDGDFEYEPNYYAYDNGYYSVIIDKKKTITEEEAIRKNTQPAITIITTYYEKDTKNGQLIDIRYKKKDGSYENIQVPCSVKRKLETKFARKQFTELAYLSDHEDEIWWANGESFKGPFHTNGDLYIQETPKFYGPVTYSGAIKGRKWNGRRYQTYEISNPGTSRPDVFLGGVTKVPTIEFPKTVESIKDIVEPDHLYTGNIRIRFDKNHPKKYFVQQLQSKKHQYFDDVFLLAWSDEQGPKNFPENGVIYIKNDIAPAMRDGKRINYDIANSQIDPRRDSRNYQNLKAKYIEKKWGFGEVANDSNAGQIVTKNQQANVFVKGDLDGRLTIVSENNIYINGDINYMEKQKSLLGLIANYDVLINHYRAENRGGFSLDTNIKENYGSDGITVNAAIYAGRQFGFELYKDSNDYNRKGYLNLHGALINHERGFVGVIKQSGFDKRYSYDDRLQSTTPPHFIQPINAPWEIKYERERN
ncbi:MAG: hypothetical protein N4A40_10645 [Tissierellales bacterium]|jgi:hypothetical protein|nr:hypothetical protein [Tissierellales bacterium]